MDRCELIARYLRQRHGPILSRAQAETEPRFAEINRGISADEFCGALELARAAGLWRFDTRWRRVIPHGTPVWLPRIQRLANTA